MDKKQLWPRTPLELKAKLLCEGFWADDRTLSLFQQQNPSNAKRGGLSSGGKMRLESGVFVNAPFYRYKKTEMRIQKSLYDRTDGQRELEIWDKDAFMCNATALSPPAWYGQKVGKFEITQILTAHNRQLATAVYEDCSLFSKGEQCRFCVINQSLQDKDPALVRKSPELLLSALRCIPLGEYGGITINGGMTFSPGRGMEVVEPIVRAISREFPGFSISVEMTPPSDLSYIDRIVDAGAGSLMMNLETWDSAIREKLIPGKDKYCPKDSYLAAFSRVVSLLGKGRVSTCFVVGTEPMESLKQGISEVMRLGVVPSPLAGRSFEDVMGYPFKPDADWREFLEIIKFAQQEAFSSGLKALDKAGCVACGMCDLIKDFAG